MAEGWIVCLLLIFLSRVDALPNPNVEEVEIADHVAGMPMERDGDLNTVREYSETACISLSFPFDSAFLELK